MKTGLLSGYVALVIVFTCAATGSQCPWQERTTTDIGSRMGQTTRAPLSIQSSLSPYATPHITSICCNPESISILTCLPSGQQGSASIIDLAFTSAALAQKIASLALRKKSVCPWVADIVLADPAFKTAASQIRINGPSEQLKRHLAIAGANAALKRTYRSEATINRILASATFNNLVARLAS